MKANLQIKPDIIALSETWLTKDRHNKFSIEGYTFLHDTSPSNSGGVSCFIHNSISMQVTNDYCLQLEGCEDMWLNTKGNNDKPIIVGIIYRHPKSNLDQFEETFYEIIDKLNIKKERVPHWW